MEKTNKIPKSNLLERAKRYFRPEIWLWLAPVVTVCIAIIAWLTLALSASARTNLRGFFTDVSMPVGGGLTLVILGLAAALAAVLYFYIDYQQQAKRLKLDDPSFKYAPVNHAQKVVLPKLKYNWRQGAYWLAYGLSTILILSSVLAAQTNRAFAYAPNEFVTTWKTNNSGNPNEIWIGANTEDDGLDNGSYTYNYAVDWGDGNISTGQTGNAGHTYATAGTYTVKITGLFPQGVFGGAGYGETDLMSVEQWGSNQWQSMEGSFENVGSLIINATDSPDLSQVTSMASMFANTTMNSDISSWDVSTVTDMRSLFYQNPAFNQPLNSWNVGNVTDMTFMFGYATAFNQPLNSWNVGNVEDMKYMFANASSFNGEIGDWNVHKITNMEDMFFYASAFNQPIGGWNVSSVTNMHRTFGLAVNFNQPLNSWNVSSVTDMSSLFAGASSFNQPLNNWNVSSVTNMSWMLAQASSFNKVLNNWNVSNVTDMSYMFWNATAFNQSLGSWNVSNVTQMNGMFTQATALSTPHYDATLLGWSQRSLQSDVTLNAAAKYCNANTARSSIISNFGWTILDGGLNCTGAYASNQFVTTWQPNIEGGSNSITIPTNSDETYNYSVDWNNDGVMDQTGITGDVTHNFGVPGTYTIRITGTFPAIRFGGDGGPTGNSRKIIDIDQWGTNSWNTMSFAFAGATNLQISAPDTPNLTNVTDMSYMFSNAYGFNQNINNWNVSHATNLSGMFSGARSFNQPLNSWNVSSVTDMSSMFFAADLFNQPLNSWSVGVVTSMYNMFASAAYFNQPLNSWNVSSVTDMSNMFASAYSFNQPLNSWNVGNVTDMSSMFGYASAFNQPLASWNTTNVADMSSMFWHATSFNQNLATWNMESVGADGPLYSGAEYMLNDTALSTANYDSTLIGWAGQSLQSDVPFGAIPAKYCVAAEERQAIIDNFGWVISDGGEDCGPSFADAFITTWKTDNPGDSDSDQITIPTDGTGYDYTVDWGDGNISTDQTGDATHTYASPGTYTVKIIGDFPQIRLWDSDSAEKLLSVDQWGSNHWRSMAFAFGGASNLTVPATDTPDLSGVINMSGMFFGASSFNQNINNWDVSNVEDIYMMFDGATLFNQPLNSWNVSNVISMDGVFIDAAAFNQPLDNWDVSGVLDTGFMFAGADSFNQNIDNWDVSSVTNMSGMFAGAGSFNQPVDDWDVSSVEDMWGMFHSAVSFNQPLNDWDTSSVTNISSMFTHAHSFNQPLSNWSTTNVDGYGYNNNGMEATFAYATSFNQNINSWDVSNVKIMYSMFLGATSFNQPLDNWDTGNVQVMGNMFMKATSFNQPLNNWDTGSVYYFMFMFADATSFNQPLSNWNTGGGGMGMIGMTAMFAGAASFDQSLANWDVSHVANATYMFNKEPLDLGAGFDFAPAHGLSTANYDATLASWSAQSLVNDITFDAGASTYCNSAAQRASIITDFNWTINDSGESCTNNSKQAHTDQPAKISDTQAKLNGIVSGTGAGEFVSAGFEWGESQSFGDSVNNLAISGNQFNYQGDFKCGTQYYYRAFAVDGANAKTYGDTVVFALACPAGVNNEAPVIRITAPKDNQTFEKNETITLSAEASDPDGDIKSVRFYLNGKEIGISYKAPYTMNVHGSDIGGYTFIAVAEDDKGVKTASGSVNFGVSITSSTSLVQKPSEPGVGPDISKDIKKPVVFGGSSYKPRSLPLKIARSLPWVLLQGLAVGYMVLAYRQAAQNSLLKRGLGLTNRTRENIESFLNIITHYLGTSVTLIGLSSELLPEDQHNTSTTRFRAIVVQLKEYSNSLIKNLTAQVEVIKSSLENGGTVSSPSIYKWVLLPCAIALLLLLVSFSNILNANLWSGEAAAATFTWGILLGSIVAVYVFFVVWQHQRQLMADLAATTDSAERALQVRRKFIASTQASLSSQVAIVSQQGNLVAGSPAFKKPFDSGIKQLRQVSDAFTDIMNLTTAVSAGTVRAFIPIKQIIGEFEPLAAEKKLNLIVKVPAKVKTQLLPKELDHTLRTLLTNAIQFTPEGGEVTVTAHSSRFGFSLEVTDTGTGIAKDKLPTLMQPFARGTSTKTYNYEGLGVNLYITRLIAEKYHGSVTIESTEGKGTRVAVKI